MTDERVEEKLLPCPFCNHAVELHEDYSEGGTNWISHVPKPGGHDCPMEFSGFNVESQSRLTDLWNARAPPMSRWLSGRRSRR